MKLLKFGRAEDGRYLWAYVDCTATEFQAVLHNPREGVDLEGHEMCLFTLAKGYYRPLGFATGMIDWDSTPCFYVNGYHGDDVTRVLQRLGLVE